MVRSRHLAVAVLGAALASAGAHPAFGQAGRAEIRGKIVDSGGVLVKE